MWEFKSLALSTMHIISHLYSKSGQMNCVSDIVKECTVPALLFITCNVLLSCDNLTECKELIP
jgi:hypothetical protein